MARDRSEFRPAAQPAWPNAVLRDADETGNLAIITGRFAPASGFLIPLFLKAVM
jgi:hypothetical protein